MMKVPSREIAQEDAVDDVLVGLAIDQQHLGIQWGGEGHVPLETLLLAVLGLLEPIVEPELLGLRHTAGEIQLQRTVEAFNRRDLVKEVAQSFGLEPLERLELNFDQGGQFAHIGDLSVGLHRESSCHSLSLNC
jgi:hypothetical protein